MLGWATELLEKTEPHNYYVEDFIYFFHVFFLFIYLWIYGNKNPAHDILFSANTFPLNKKRLFPTKVGLFENPQNLLP